MEITMKLEPKIAAALADDAIASTALASLISETEAAINAADEAAEAERAKALDPVLSPDPNRARQAMEDAAFTRDRLRTVLPRLHERLRQSQEGEYLAQWRISYEALEVKRDALATQLRDLYPTVVASLVDADSG
jgi:hypothetical protein